MRSRRVVAAVAGVAGACLAHALDVAGLLPFVHEAAAVRNAMSPGSTAAWLLLTGVLCALTARRPATAGAAAALFIGGLPELAGRLDPGAIFEPAAIAGALLQWLLLVLVLSLAFAVLTVLTTEEVSSPFLPALGRLKPPGVRPFVSQLAARAGRSRAPPVSRCLSRSHPCQRGPRCTEDFAAA